MKAKTLQILWHDKLPIFSVDFEPRIAESTHHHEGRLATGGADSNVRIWRLKRDEEGNPDLEFLSSLNRHAAAVNCVRWSPKGGILASTGDDGMIILWQQSELHRETGGLGDEDNFNKETWKTMGTLRGTGSEFYDLAWSPDANYIIAASIDNTARIYDLKTMKCIHVLADHTHYVQGVAWDPLCKYIATQSCDRTVNMYTYDTPKPGSLTTRNVAKHSKLDMWKHVQKEKSSSTDATSNVTTPRLLPKIDIESGAGTPSSHSRATSPAPSVSTAADELMQPPPPSPRRLTHSRPPSPRLLPCTSISQLASNNNQKSIRMYHDEDLTSFFRRLTFTPDGALLLTPAGQYKGMVDIREEGKNTEAEMKNTVYVYARGKMTGEPVAYLPGHKKPSIAVRCSPILYQLRPNVKVSSTQTQVTSADESSEASSSSTLPQPASLFQLPHRVVYAVATQDSVLVYDSQQTTPLVLLSNLHYATFSDLAWSPDGNTLILSSTDGYCSVVSFEPQELGIPMPADHISKFIAEHKEEKSLGVKEAKSGTKFVTPPQTPGSDGKVTPSTPSAAHLVPPTNKRECDPSTDSSDATDTKKRRIAPTFLRPLESTSKPTE